MRAGLFFLGCLFSCGAWSQEVAYGDTGGRPGFCEQERLQRQQDINRNPDIESTGLLHEQGGSTCFSPHENLYFTALMAAEETLGEHAPWYREISDSSREKALKACRVLGYEGSRLAMEQCQAARYRELMHRHEARYESESISYINRRNRQAEQLVQECVAALHQNLHKLPQSILLPVAYYDRNLRTYPAWYVEERVDDQDWLENIQGTRAHEVLEATLEGQCPGDMIWWLYPLQDSPAGVTDG